MSRRAPGRKKDAAERAAHRARVQAYRQRLSDGQVVSRIRHSLDDAALMLVAMGRLRKAEEYDRGEVEKALQDWLDERMAEFSSDASQRDEG